MPRISDFDPNVQVPDLASPLDNLPAIKPPTKQKPHDQRTEQLLPSAHSSELHDRSVYFRQQPERTVERSNGRRMRRRASYELFTDQIEAIQRLALEDKLQGGTGNQSDMVRTAIDEYLKQRRGEK